MEKMMSYLRGCDSSNYYSAPGLFRGSLPAGFTFSCLFRDPGEASGGVALVGNMENLGGGPVELAGWALILERDINEIELAFLYGESDNTGNSLGGTLINSPVSQRTLLVTVFFGALAEGKTPVWVLFVNGTLMNVLDLPATDIDNGYAPASAGNPFKLGAGDAPGFEGGDGIGFAGFAFANSAPTGADSGAVLDACAVIAREQWEAVEETEDLVNSSGAWSDIYSVRRGLPSPAPAWAASIGATSLARVGSDSLVTEAAKPRFWSGMWTSPAADPD